MGRTPKIDGRKAGSGPRGITFPAVQPSQVVEPEGLSVDAAFAWKNAISSMVPSRVLAHADLLALEAACRAWGRWRMMERQIDELGRSGSVLSGEMSKTPNGHVQMSALRIAAKQALGEFMSIAKDFGMTPVSRVRTAGSAQGTLFDLLPGEGE